MQRKQQNMQKKINLYFLFIKLREMYHLQTVIVT